MNQSKRFNRRLKRAIAAREVSIQVPFFSFQINISECVPCILEYFLTSPRQLFGKDDLKALKVIINSIKMNDEAYSFFLHCTFVMLKFHILCRYHHFDDADVMAFNNVTLNLRNVLLNLNHFRISLLRKSKRPACLVKCSNLIVRFACKTFPRSLFTL